MDNFVPALTMTDSRMALDLWLALMDAHDTARQRASESDTNKRTYWTERADAVGALKALAHAEYVRLADDMRARINHSTAEENQS